MRIRDRLDPREIAEANKETASQDEADDEQPQAPKGYTPEDRPRSRGNDNKRDH
jgi:hypothetical protein